MSQGCMPSELKRGYQGWKGPGNLPGLPHEMVQHYRILPGSILGKVIQSTNSKSKMPGDPWRALWPCRDQRVIPVDFAGAVQPWRV